MKAHLLAFLMILIGSIHGDDSKEDIQARKNAWKKKNIRDYK